MGNSKKVRYSRHVLLTEIGENGQKKLSNGTAVIIGVGALGNVIANNLVRFGVGIIKVVDRDIVESSNLPRSILFDEQDIGEPKVIAATDALRRINSDTDLIPIQQEFNSNNVESIINGADVILDGSDNMETRFLINDACVKNNLAWVYGGVIGTYGMTMNIIPRKTACFRCFLPNVPNSDSLPNCDTTGVLSAIPQVIGAIQSVEAIKIMLGSKSISRNLISYDVWKHDFTLARIARNKNCKCCGKHNFEFLNAKKKVD